MPKVASGFTLVELVVVFAIIGVITTVIFTSQNSFNKTLIVSNTAYDIALTLRAAETYGIGSRAAGATNNAGFGLDFTRATPNQFTLFTDTYPSPSTSSVCHPTSDASSPSAKPGNCSYDAPQGERVTTYTIGNGITVSDFCALSLGSWACAHANGGGLSSLDVVFSRPNPVPFISVNGTYSTLFPATDACLIVSSAQGGVRYITITSSGQISTSATPCI